MMLSPTDIQHIFERLRKGMVPERGLHAFAVGVENTMIEIKRHLQMTRMNEGSCKFLRGDYGCGKTFISQLSMSEALEKNFAVSKVVISPNDTPLYKFDQIYARIVGNLQTQMAKGGTLADCIDRWISRVEDRLIAEGENEDAPNFDNLVRQRFEYELAELNQEEAGADFITVIREYFRRKQEGDMFSAMQLLAWLSGSPNIAASVKRTAGIKGNISNQSAFTYLKGVLLIIKKSGHPGLLVVIDEMETILRMRSDIREKSLNGLRQIIDATPDYKGLMWLFTGTPEFYDSRKGVAGLIPLHDRIYFRKSGEFVNLKQAQLELKPFDKDKLLKVGLQLRDLYPADDRKHIEGRMPDVFIERLVQQISNGFGGKVGIIPRLFLREFVDILDLIEQNAEYDPMNFYEMNLRDINPEEHEALTMDLEEEVEDVEF